MRYFKVTNAAEKHNGLQYKDGLNIDPVAWNPSGNCQPGGIYYADEDHICECMGVGAWVREVTVPDDARTYKDPVGNKFKADKVILGPRVALLDFLKEYVEARNGVIPGSLDLSGLTSAKGLVLPTSIGGGLNLSGLTSAEGLVLPTTIGGGLYLRDSVRRELGKRKK